MCRLTCARARDLSSTKIAVNDIIEKATSAARGISINRSSFYATRSPSAAVLSPPFELIDRHFVCISIRECAHSLPRDYALCMMYKCDETAAYPRISRISFAHAASAAAPRRRFSPPFLPLFPSPPQTTTRDFTMLKHEENSRASRNTTQFASYALEFSRARALRSFPRVSA